MGVIIGSNTVTLPMSGAPMTPTGTPPEQHTPIFAPLEQYTPRCAHDDVDTEHGPIAHFQVRFLGSSLVTCT